jgi:hypothetical protein
MRLYIYKKNDRYAYSFNNLGAEYLLYGIQGLVSYADTMRFVSDFLDYINTNPDHGIKCKSIIMIEKRFNPSRLRFMTESDLPRVTDDAHEYIRMLAQPIDEPSVLVYNPGEVDLLRELYETIWIYVQNEEISVKMSAMMKLIRENSFYELISEFESVLEVVDRTPCMEWISIKRYDDSYLQRIFDRLVNAITRERKGDENRSLCLEITYNSDENYRYCTHAELRVFFEGNAFDQDHYLIPSSNPRLFHVDFRVKAYLRDLIKVFESENPIFY